MPRLRRLLIVLPLVCGGFVHFAGCGATRSTDTLRTATEQLLISDAIDRAVQTMNLQALAGQSVFLDDTKLSDTVDKNYYISTLRQHLLATGCDLRDKREDADFIVEARAGAIGTDRNDLLFGIPSMNMPSIPLVQPVPAAIPEIPIAKRKDQRGVAKIAVFAYHRATGTPVWQSGIVRRESSANDVWIFGAGPFQRGTIYDETMFAGKAIGSEPSKADGAPKLRTGVSVTQEDMFNAPSAVLAKATKAKDAEVVLASHTETAPANPVAPGAVPASTTPSAPPVAKVAAALPSGEKLAEGALMKSELAKPPAIDSAYVKAGQTSPLPQPRFNSPK
jgi:hypothetical protein